MGEYGLGVAVGEEADVADGGGVLVEGSKTVTEPALVN